MFRRFSKKLCRATIAAPKAAVSASFWPFSAAVYLATPSPAPSQVALTKFQSQQILITLSSDRRLVPALKLAMGCCAPVPEVNPTMDEVVKHLEENRPRNRSALNRPTETRSGTVTPL